MTDEEIRKMAEDCSLYYQGKPARRGYELSNRLTIESYALMTLKWLAERYCIVEKSKVKEVYDNHIRDIKKKYFHFIMPEVENYMQATYRSALQILFGSDTFNKEKK